MKKKLVIVGTGLFSEVARCYFEEYTEYEVVGFACHQEYRKSETAYGLSLLAIENLSISHPPSEVALFVAIGYKKMNKIRQRVYEELKQLGYTFATFVHPNVKIWSNSTVGENVFIFEDNTIQPFTQIGNNTMLWSGNHIGHHTEIGDHCFISSHVVISGSCRLGDNIFVGVNATFHDSLCIASETLVGAGAIISKDTNIKDVFVPSNTKLFPKNSEMVGF